MGDGSETGSISTKEDQCSLKSVEQNSERVDSIAEEVPPAPVPATEEVSPQEAKAE